MRPRLVVKGSDQLRDYNGIPLAQPTPTTAAARAASAPLGTHLRRDLWERYARPSPGRSLLQLLDTLGPFAVLVGTIGYGLHRGIWEALVLAPLTAGLLLRLFMILHDCGHQSFFRRRWANDLLGRALGVLTFTPYGFWKRAHAVHHATSGNLDRRGVGDITTLTVREYLASSPLRRTLYRVYRNPIVLFGIGPIYQFGIRHRIPTGHLVRGWRDWASILGTNLVLAATGAALAWIIGWRLLLLTYSPVALGAAQLGVWLFFLQHQFEDTYWACGSDWDFQAAALNGSSFYDLPAILRWFTANIGFHHVHHLCSRIPNYGLRQCFEANSLLANAKRLSLLDSLACPRLALWDEEARRLVPFSQVHRAVNESLPPGAPIGA